MDIRISATITNVMASICKYPVRFNLETKGMILELVSSFNYLRCEISHKNDYDVISELNKFTP